MAEETLSQRWAQYQPSKTLWFWSCIVCIAATIVVGFTWGGWVTGGSAENMAQKAAQDGRTKLAAALCVNQFVASPAAAKTFTEIKDASSWNRGDIIEKGGWAKIKGIKDDVNGVADACAAQIAAMEALPAAGADTAADTTAGAKAG